MSLITSILKLFRNKAMSDETEVTVPAVAPAVDAAPVAVADPGSATAEAVAAPAAVVAQPETFSEEFLDKLKAALIFAGHEVSDVWDEVRALAKKLS